MRASPARSGQRSKYRLFPLVGQQNQERLFDEDGHEPSRFVVCSEKHGIPQTRHRVIILGVREDIHVRPSQLQPSSDRQDLWPAIADLPKIRAVLSRESDSPRTWAASIRKVLSRGTLPASEVDGAVRAGDYKLLEYFENDTVQLFNLRDDVGEQSDLSGTEPEKAAQLRSMLHAWRKDVSARMMDPNPDFDPAR